MLHARLSSMKAAIFLMAALIALCLSGIPQVFERWYFTAVIALLGINLLFCFLTAAWRSSRTGMWLVHLSVLVILAGALVTKFFKEQGFIEFREGEVRRSFISAAGMPSDLGFALRLDGFRVDHYDGARWKGKIKGFSSAVSVIENGRVVRQRNIEVNRPLNYRRYVFYQSGYDPAQPGWTALRVVKDPGAAIVFLGFALLNIGAVTAVLRRGGDRG